MRYKRSGKVESLDFPEGAYAVIHPVHLYRVSWRSYCPNTRVAEVEKPGQSGGSAVGDADSPVTCPAKQFYVFLLVLFSSPREDNPTPLTSLDATSLHLPARFCYI